MVAGRATRAAHGAAVHRQHDHASKDGYPNAQWQAEARNQEHGHEKRCPSSHKQPHGIHAALVTAVMTLVGVVFCRLSCFIHHGAPDLRPRVDNPAPLKSSP
jgi:hypothetical protein